MAPACIRLTQIPETAIKLRAGTPLTRRHRRAVTCRMTDGILTLWLNNLSGFSSRRRNTKETLDSRNFKTTGVERWHLWHTTRAPLFETALAMKKKKKIPQVTQIFEWQAARALSDFTSQFGKWKCWTLRLSSAGNQNQQTLTPLIWRGGDATGRRRGCGCMRNRPSSIKHETGQKCCQRASRKTRARTRS